MLPVSLSAVGVGPSLLRVVAALAPLMVTLGAVAVAAWVADWILGFFGFTPDDASGLTGGRGNLCCSGSVAIPSEALIRENV